MTSETTSRNELSLGMVLGVATTLLLASFLLAFNVELLLIVMWWGVAVAMHFFLVVILIKALTQASNRLWRVAAIGLGLAVYVILYYLSFKFRKYFGGPIGLVSIPLFIMALSIKAYPKLTLFRRYVVIGLFIYMLLSIIERNFSVYLMHHPRLTLPFPLTNYLDFLLGGLKLMFVATMGIVAGAWVARKFKMPSYSPGKVIAIAVFLIPLSICAPYGIKALYMHNLYDRLIDSREIPEYPGGKVVEKRVHVINPTLSLSRSMGWRLYVHTEPDLVFSVEITGADEDTVYQFYKEELTKRRWRYNERGDIFEKGGSLFSLTGRSKFIRLKVSSRESKVTATIKYSRFNQ